MRTIFAFILGIAVTVGGAYYHDKFMSGSDGAAAKPMVNWEVVSQNVSATWDLAVAQFNKLTSK